MTKKMILTLLLLVFASMVSFSADADFEKKLKTIRIPSESDFKGQPLSDVLSSISKISNVSIVAAAEVADLKIDLYLPSNQTLEKIIETIKTTNGLIGEIRNDTLILKRASTKTIESIKYGKVVGKVTEIDKITGIKGVTLSLGDDVNTLVMSDVGGAFIMDNVKPGTYILKAVSKGYVPTSEIIEVKPAEDTKINLVLAKLSAGPSKPGTEDRGSIGKVITEKGDIKNTKMIEVTYADPSEIKAIVAPIVPLDNIVIDPKNNVLILIGTEDNISTAETLIRKLDVSTKQIRIKARIFDINKSNANSLGINWNVADKDEGYDFGGKASYNNTNGLNLTFSDISEDALKASLDILASTDDAKVEAEPSVVTLNGEPARIAVTDEEIVGYLDETKEDGSSSRAPLFKEAGIILEVTPSIKTDKTILVDIYCKVSKFSNNAVYSNAAEKKSDTKTKIRVKNGEPIRIGGLIRKDSTKGISKVPFLGDIPIIGAAFRNTLSNEINRELWVEIIPEVID